MIPYLIVAWLCAWNEWCVEREQRRMYRAFREYRETITESIL